MNTNPANLVVVVACGAAKADGPRPALDLYTSRLSRIQAAWARSVTDESRIVVMSGQHGLVAATTVLAPYETRIDSPDSVDDATLAAQAREFGLSGTTITIAGEAYRRRLLRATGGTVWPVHPFVEQARVEGGPNGIGRLEAALRAHLGVVPPHPARDTRLRLPGEVTR